MRDRDEKTRRKERRDEGHGRREKMRVDRGDGREEIAGYLKFKIYFAFIGFIWVYCVYSESV